jgi:hypothetical protein
MSLIGRHVIVEGIKGLVVEKYRGLSREKEDAPSGHGGSMEINVFKSIDFYMIQTENDLIKVKATKISKILPLFEIETIKNETTKSE